MLHIKEPFLLAFSVLWIAFCLLPIQIRSTKMKEPPIQWPERMLFAMIGAATLLL
jgi:hypothetical protein